MNEAFFSPKKLISGYVYIEQWSCVLARCGRCVCEWVVTPAEKNIRRQRCKKFVKLILRPAGVCSCVVCQIGTFGGTFSIFMAVCRSVKSHRYAVWSPPYKRQRKMFEGGPLSYRSLRTMQSRNTLWLQLFTAASRLVRGCELQNATCRMLGFWWPVLHKTHRVFITKTGQLMLFREITAVCCDICIIIIII